MSLKFCIEMERVKIGGGGGVYIFSVLYKVMTGQLYQRQLSRKVRAKNIFASCKDYKYYKTRLFLQARTTGLRAELELFRRVNNGMINLYPET